MRSPRKNASHGRHWIERHARLEFVRDVCAWQKLVRFLFTPMVARLVWVLFPLDNFHRDRFLRLGELEMVEANERIKRKMFNLEKSISEWRKQMLAAGIKTPVPLEELEIHLREEIELQLKLGLRELEAFNFAAEKIGRPG